MQEKINTLEEEKNTLMKGFRLGWGEHGLNEDYHKYKSPDAYDAALSTNGREKKIFPLSINFKFLEDISVSDDEETKVTNATSELVVEQNEEKTHTFSPG